MKIQRDLRKIAHACRSLTSIIRSLNRYNYFFSNGMYCLSSNHIPMDTELCLLLPGIGSCFGHKDNVSVVKLVHSN